MALTLQPGSLTLPYVTAVDTDANLRATYSGAAFSGYRFRAIDGICGYDLINNGAGRLIPANGVAMLDQTNMPLLLAPTFTGTTNGAITLGTALGLVNAKCYMYFDTNTLNASQAAGFYPVAFTTTTAGVAYNNVYVPAVGTRPSWPTSPTAFSGAVPGGAGVTSQVTAFKFRVPANLLGLCGALIGDLTTSWTSSANNKTFALISGATTFSQITTTTSVSMHGELAFKNCGDAAIQMSGQFNNNGGSTSSGLAAAYDTTTDIDLSLTMQRASATDNIGIRMADFYARVMQ